MRVRLPDVVRHGARAQRRAREQDDRRQCAHFLRELWRLAPRVGRGEARRAVGEEAAQRYAPRAALPRRAPEVDDPRHVRSVRKSLCDARLLAEGGIEHASAYAVHKRLEESKRGRLVPERDAPYPTARALAVADGEGRALELHLHCVARRLAHPRELPRPFVAPRLPLAGRPHKRIRPGRNLRRKARKRQQHRSRCRDARRN